MRIATILTQLGAGTAGFAATVQPMVEAGQNVATDFVQQAATGLENPNNYVKGLLVSGLIQIVLRLIDKWSEKRKAKKAAEKEAAK